jgi:general stress protein YciG
MSTSRRGFAGMSKVKHREASRKGGKALKEKGLSRMTPEKRREIALQGTQESAKTRNQTPERRSEIARQAARARWNKK